MFLIKCSYKPCASYRVFNTGCKWINVSHSFLAFVTSWIYCKTMVKTDRKVSKCEKRVWRQVFSYGHHCREQPTGEGGDPCSTFTFLQSESVLASPVFLTAFIIRFLWKMLCQGINWGSDWAFTDTIVPFSPISELQGFGKGISKPSPCHVHLNWIPRNCLLASCGSVGIKMLRLVEWCIPPVGAGGSPVHTKVQRPRGHQQLRRLRGGGNPRFLNRKVCKGVCRVLGSEYTDISGKKGIFALF